MHELNMIAYLMHAHELPLNESFLAQITCSCMSFPKSKPNISETRALQYKRSWYSESATSITWEYTILGKKEGDCKVVLSNVPLHITHISATNALITCERQSPQTWKNVHQIHHSSCTNECRVKLCINII